MELRRAMRQRNRANKKRDVSHTIPTQDDRTGEHFERDENSSFVSEYYDINRVSKRRSPIDLSEATLYTLYRRGEKSAAFVSRL